MQVLSYLLLCVLCLIVIQLTVHVMSKACYITTIEWNGVVQNAKSIFNPVLLLDLQKIEF